MRLMCVLLTFTIAFRIMSDNDETHRAISKQLIERQGKVNTNAQQVIQTPAASQADEFKEI